MRTHRIVFSDAAVTDIVEQFDWYADKSGRNLANRWQASVTATLLKIAKGPRVGLPCHFGAAEL